jgi:uncharacterized protein
MNNIEKTITFLEDAFQNEHSKKNPQDTNYRLEHTYRVANLGKVIAESEGLHVDGLVIGCLLHDLSYSEEFLSHEEHKAHGRKSARMAREFVYTLDLPDHIKEELLYGIAIHVDDISDFEGDRTVLAETISECDNIDRFGKYRLYEFMKWGKIEEKSIEEQRRFASEKIDRLKYLKETFVHKTETSNELWNKNLDYQIEYFSLLLEQLQQDREVLLK